MMQNARPVILADMGLFGEQMAPYLTDTCPECEVLVTPLIADREPLGALVLLNSRASGRHFRDGDVIRARTLGDLTSLALRRVRLMEQEREAKEKAEAAVRVRDETLGIVSHDLRNPLTKIVISADLLADATPEEQPELVDTIRTAARQMERLIQDLLDVARLESGNLTVARETVDPNAIMREMCESNELVAQRKQQRIVCHVPEHLPDICGDRDRLVQVFGNLIGNAMKFAPERGVITIEARAEGKFVRFTVRDTGPGMPEADLKKVFTPYWQAKKTAHMGAGLGLAIVRGIVEAHGGHVWAENASGGGAVFTFTINGDAISTNGYAIRLNGYTIRTNGYTISTNGYTISTNGYAISTNGYAIRINGYAIGATACAIGTNGCAIGANGCAGETNGDIVEANACATGTNGAIVRNDGATVRANGAIIRNYDPGASPSVTGSVSVRLPRTMRTLTVSPGRRARRMRIRSALLRTAWSSIAVMKSSARMPARCAGAPRVTCTTTIPSSIGSRK
jgi:signal transduction histidine kinase